MDFKVPPNDDIENSLESVSKSGETTIKHLNSERESEEQRSFSQTS